MLVSVANHAVITFQSLRPLRLSQLILPVAAALALTACKTAPKPGAIAPRTGDEIIIAGHLVHTGARVVTWNSSGASRFRLKLRVTSSPPHPASGSRTSEVAARRRGWRMTIPA